MYLFIALFDHGFEAVSIYNNYKIKWENNLLKQEWWNVLKLESGDGCTGYENTEWHRIVYLKSKFYGIWIVYR